MLKNKEETASQILKKNTVYVEKNQTDMTAGLTYSLGTTLLHLSLLISMFFVKEIDLESAK
jgi:hypothetical protein